MNNQLNIPDVLPNGYSIVNIMVKANGEGVVLGVSETGGEWATWAFNGMDLKGTYWGHYFTDVVEAKEDFIDRVSKDAL